jgi:hypothetical protein
MAFEKVEYTFPDEENKKPDIEIKKSSANEVNLDVKEEKNEESDSKPSKPDNDVEVEVVNDVPKADRDRKISEPPAEVTEEELNEYSEKVQTRLKHFSKGYHDERRAKEQATREKEELERVTQQLLSENKKLKGTVGKNQTVLLDQAKRTATAELEQAKKLFKEAYDSGEADAVVTAQENLTAAKIRAEKVENIKLPALQEENTSVEPIKNNTPAVDGRTKEWANANTWFGTDDEMTSLALGLHNKLVKQYGKDYVNTDEYYEKIDSRVRQLFPEYFGETNVPKSKSSSVVAPVKRSTSPKKITLTQTQVSIAKRLGLTPEQYAKQVALDMRKDNG